MSNSYDPPTGPGPRKRRTFLIPVIGGTVALLLIAGTAVGVHASNAETSKRCAEATTTARSINDAITTSVGKAAKARTVAHGTKGYGKADSSATVLTGLDKATRDLDTGKLSTECATHDQAATLVSSTATAAAKRAALNEIAVRRGDHATVFKAAEAKRIATEKKAAEEKAAAARACSAAQTPEVPQYVAPEPVGDTGSYMPATIPAAPNPAPYVPAPAPYVPDPAPAAAGGGGIPGGGSVICDDGPNKASWTSNGTGGLKPC